MDLPTSPTTPTTTPTTTTTTPSRGLRAVALHHAAVGLAVLLPWLVLVRLGAATGVPPVAVLLLVVAVVLPLVGAALLRRQLTAEGLQVRDRARVRDRLGLRRPAARQVLLAGLPALAAALVLPGLGLPVEAALRNAGWSAVLPSTGLTVPLDPHGQLGGAGTAALLAVWVVVAVLVGPVVEEVLFRGLLQPLLPGGPWARVLLGSAIFAVYHLWQPTTWLTVLLATLPAAWVRERTGCTWLAAGVHVAANAAALALLLAGGLRR
jgi:uncharacterized protein